MKVKKSLIQVTFLIFVIGTIEVSTGTGVLRDPKFLRHLAYTNKDLTLNYKIDDDVILTYALCEIQSHGRENRICTLKLERIGWDGSMSQKSCPIQLSRRKPDDPDYRKYKLTYLGGNELVFVWKQREAEKRQTRSRVSRRSNAEEHLKLLIVNMETCHVRTNELVAEEQSVRNRGNLEAVSIVVRNNGNFDALVRNRNLCGERTRCGRSYDLGLRRFNPLFVSLPINYYASAEAYPLATSDGVVRAHVVHSRLSQDGLLQIVGLNGSVLYEHGYSYSIVEIPVRVSNLAFSHAEASLGFCQQPLNKPTLECSLFDHEGRAKVGILVNLNTADVAVLKIRNTPAGGFLIFVGYADESNRLGFKEFEMLEINKAGDVLGSWEGINERCPMEEIDIGLINVKESEFCYYMVCTRSNADAENGEKALLFHKNCNERNNNV